MDGRTTPRFSGLSLVLPAFNEEATIQAAIEEADAALAQLARDYEILIVDDGCTDQTAAIARQAIARHPKARLLSHSANQGYGSALRTGFQAARFDRVAFTDADCQFHLTDLAPLLELTEEVPVAIGYRVERKDRLLRRFVSWGYNRLTKALLGIQAKDCDCALKVFRRDALQNLLPQSNGFFVNTEMLTRARAYGYRVGQVGVRHRPRLNGTSTVSWSQIPRILATLLPFWWTQVLFPGGRQTERSPSGQSFWAFPLILFASLLLFFTQLHCPLLEPQEARYAEISRQMWTTGEWLTPQLHGQPYYDKPPLLYWLIMSSYSLFGPQDWAARLIPGLAGVATILLVYFWGSRTVSQRAGLIASMMLCLSIRFVYLGRMLTFDIVLALMIVAALAFAHLALQNGTFRWKWWLLSATALGLAILTKGPVAIVLVVVPLAAFQCLDSRNARPQWQGWTAYFMVTGLVAAPWFVYLTLHDPGFAHYFFWQHHVVRFLQPFDHQEPYWFFLPGILFGMLPWTLLLPGMARFLLRRSRRVAARRPVAMGFFLLCFFWGLLFFSLSGCKRAVYILPILPLMALVLGSYLDAWLPYRAPMAQILLQPLRGGWLARRATLMVLCLATLGGLAGVIVQMIPLGVGLVLILVPLLIVSVLLRAKEHRYSWGACAAVTFAMLFLAVQYALPAYNQRFAIRRCVTEQRSVARKTGAPIACYPQPFNSVSFYLQQEIQAYSHQQRDQLIADALRRPRTLLFVKSGRSLKGLLEALPSTLELRQIDRQGKVTVGWLQPRRTQDTGAIAQR